MTPKETRKLHSLLLQCQSKLDSIAKSNAEICGRLDRMVEEGQKTHSMLDSMIDKLDSIDRRTGFLVESKKKEMSKLSITKKKIKKQNVTILHALPELHDPERNETRSHFYSMQSHDRRRHGPDAPDWFPDIT